MEIQRVGHSTLLQGLRTGGLSRSPGAEALVMGEPHTTLLNISERSLEDSPLSDLLKFSNDDWHNSSVTCFKITTMYSLKFSPFTVEREMNLFFSSFENQVHYKKASYAFCNTFIF
uniref:Uncharacterized protein n=1 Tax=Anser brachyrhynchus TaxID=132585 RepID=A0A8B9BFY0_9AVES